MNGINKTGRRRELIVIALCLAFVGSFFLAVAISSIIPVVAAFGLLGLIDFLGY